MSGQVVRFDHVDCGCEILTSILCPAPAPIAELLKDEDRRHAVCRCPGYSSGGRSNGGVG